jgi:lysozyme
LIHKFIITRELPKYCDNYIYAYCTDRVDERFCHKQLVRTTVPTRQPIRVADGCETTALARADQPSRILATELSSHNSDLDLPRIIRDGYYVVTIKATQGESFIGRNFKQNWEAAGKAGLIRLAYHFLTDGSPERQANFFLKVLQSVTIGPCDLGVMLDFEASPFGKNPTAQQAVVWLAAVQSSLHKLPFLYSGSYLKSLGSDVPRELASYPLWLAQYRSVPMLPANYSQYVFWEFTDGSSGPRAGTLLDGVASSTVFNGSREQLFAFAK